MEKVDVQATMIGGEWAGGAFGEFAPREPFVYPAWARQTMRVGGGFSAADMRVSIKGSADQATVRTIRATIPKRSDAVALAVKDGVIQPDPDNGVSSIVAIDRHQASRRIGRGFVSGFFVRRGALASTVSHDAHNLMVVGADFDDMALAANQAVENGGGYVVVLGGKVLFEMPLPIAGLMSDQPIEHVAVQARDLVETLHEQLGVPRIDDQVLHQINFLALPNIPEFGFTDFGLIASDALDVLEVVIGSGSSCECRNRTFATVPAEE